MRRTLPLALLALAACDAPTATDAGAPATDAGPPPNLRLRVVTFNSGTTEGLDHDAVPDDGYSSTEALVSDTHYGDGLAWIPVVEATRAFLAEVEPDVIGFQEIFHSDDCATIPPEAHAGFVCETWSPGDPTVAQVVLGAGYQIACHLEKPDKCLAVRRAVGTIRGCDADVCLDHLDGARVPDCGGGSRVGRAVIDLVDGRALTVVSVHGSSGITAEDQACRIAQFEQIFVDLDGAPGANGAVNVVLGDLNTDPVRLASGDPSAARFAELADAAGLRFVTDVGRAATPTYAIFNIDHVLSDALDGDCWAAGITDGHPAVSDVVYFDHAPIVCDVAGFVD